MSFLRVREHDPCRGQAACSRRAVAVSVGAVELITMSIEPSPPLTTALRISIPLPITASGLPSAI